MFPIDGPGATPEKRFTEGDPVIPVPPTVVTADWLNAVQDELCAVIAAANISLSQTDNSQLLAALRRLGYELCEFYFFRHPTLRPGFQPAQGGLLTDAAARYPQAWEYLQSTEGRALCKSEADWQAMTRAVWHINADGSRVGWNGIGGAPFYAPDYATGALRLPDLRGMYAEAAGFDALDVGGVHGDAVREIPASWSHIHSAYPAAATSGAAWWHSGAERLAETTTAALSPGGLAFAASRVVPTASKVQPRAWGALVCVYLGLPSS